MIPYHSVAVSHLHGRESTRSFLCHPTRKVRVHFRLASPFREVYAPNHKLNHGAPHFWMAHWHGATRLQCSRKQISDRSLTERKAGYICCMLTIVQQQKFFFHQAHTTNLLRCRLVLAFPPVFSTPSLLAPPYTYSSAAHANTPFVCCCPDGTNFRFI